MDIKDKLNLAWKFLFLAVFTYGVMSLTCCKSSSNTCCKSQAQCSKSLPVKVACAADCQKACCAK